MRKNIIKLLALCCFFVTNSNNLHSLHQKKINLALLDPTGREAIMYKAFLDSTKAVGFNIDYIGIDNIIDQKNINSIFSQKYDGIFFILGVEFLRGITTKSPLTKKIYSLINYFSHQPNKLISLIFPALIWRNSFANIVKKFYPILAAVDTTLQKHALTYPEKIFSSPHKKNTYDDFLYLTNQFLMIPLEARASYHTTLRLPQKGIPFHNNVINKILAQNKQLHIFPSFNNPKKTSNLFRQTLPYGIYWINPTTKNHVLITSRTLLSFSGLEENFRFCPTNYSIRKKINTAVRQMMQQVYEHFTHNKTTKEKIDVASLFGKKLKKPRKQKYIKKTAWMEINLFEPLKNDPKLSEKENQIKQKDRKKRQNKLIKYILKSGLDSLWISLTPNMYYSPIARIKQHEKKFLSSISNFTKKLKDAIKRHRKSVPKIIVGFEIANNLYNENIPKRCAYDLYGNSYTDVPAPLNKKFWDNEIKKPLRTFVNKWKKISHGIPLGGVLLDLEMYCRKTSSNFLTTMGFEHKTFQKFCKAHSLKPPTTQDVHSKVHFLINNGLAHSYFSFLEKKAENLGRNLRVFFKHKIPECIIGCYAQSIFPHWFYKGFWKGLSTKKEPVHLFTFNAEFNAYKKWLLDNDIQAYHSGVLLLSKIQNKKNFKWVDYIFKHHHGVWFNRFSRLAENYNKKCWTSIEQSPLKEPSKLKFLKHIKQVN